MNLNEVMDANTIDRLLKQSGGYGTDKQTAHSYGPVYEYLLTPFMERSCTLLEVGVFFGGSLRLWHDLLPQATLLGIDCEALCAREIAELERCWVLKADAYHADTVRKTKGLAPKGLDIIIDDGPHTLASQIAFLTLYLPLLNQQGFAMIEDIQNEAFITDLVAVLDPSFEYEVIDRRHQKHRYDDLMLLVRKIPLVL